MEPKTDFYIKLTIAVIILGILLRMTIPFFAYPSGDSFKHLVAARFIATENKIPLFEPLGKDIFWAPPVFHIIAAIFFKGFSLFGYAVGLKSMEFVSPIFGSLMIILFYFFARNFLDKRKTLYAVIFLTFIPNHVYYSTLAHVDIPLAFFSMLCIYFSYKQKLIWASLVFGIGLLTKYNILFAFPLCAYLLCRKNLENCDYKSLVRKGIIFVSIAFLIGLPWYIRNFINFGNPFYHFGNFLFYKLGFNVFEYPTAGSPPLLSMLKPIFLLRAYLDLFGVPLGIPENLFAIKFSYSELFVFIWVIFTIIFFMPILLGIFSKYSRQMKIMLFLGIVPWLLMLIWYLFDEKSLYIRLFLSALPFVGILWSNGMVMLVDALKSRTLKILFLTLIAIIIFSFCSVEYAKAIFAAKQYTVYHEDHEWARINLPEDALISPPAPYLVYALDRFSVPIHNFTKYNKSNVYHWVGDKNFHKSVRENEMNVSDEKVMESVILVYSDKKSGISIYKNK